MFWYRIKLAYRSITNNKYISLFNILGLAISLAGILIILSWISHEFSYDDFFNNKENIYRLNFNAVNNNKTVKSSSSPQGVGPEALAVYPQVQNFTRIRSRLKSAFKVGEHFSYVDKGLIADSTFFSVFSYKAKFGDLSKSLNRKDLVVIDEYLAEKYFEMENPIGKVIKIGGQDYTVSAVINNVPENSHLQFHYVTPVLNLSENWHYNKWGSDNCTQYLVLKDETKKIAFEESLTQMLYEKNSIWKEYKAKLLLQPLKDIHFSEGFLIENAVKGDLQNVYILASVAFLILIIACVNFTNMFISTALKRTRTIGVKVASGAKKKIIIKELFTELIIFMIASLILSVLIVELSVPYFNNIIGANIQINYLSFNFIGTTIVLIFLTFLLAGLISGFYFSKLNLITILKSGLPGKPGKRGRIQRGLVTLQFVIAIALIISVIVIQKQVDFFKSKQLGFDKENLVYISSAGEFNDLDNLNQLKEELIKEPSIKGITARNCLPTIVDNGGYMYTRENPEDKIHGEMINIHQDYFKVMNIQFLEGGHEFDYSTSEVKNCVLNETAVKKLGFEPPYTGKLVFNVNENRYMTITGVIKDIQTKNLGQPVKPSLYTKANVFYDSGIVLFRLSSDYQAAITAIKDYYQEHNSSIPFEYHFLDQTYDQLYKNEIRMRRILSWFSVLSIILTCMGLLAMAYFITENKIKEIGIRKVNGAKVSNILSMLNAEFVNWLVVAFIIACPAAWYVMNQRLQNFAYKTELSWWIFPLAGAIALVIALLTVSWQSWRAARRNPVEALRYE